jgi:catechol 2,3-dioxygenase-like lactoylglutathione lyase family enzyme
VLEQDATEGEGASVADGGRMHLEPVSVIVRDCDEAIDFFTRVLGFDLVEDSGAVSTHHGHAKRWVVVRPPGERTGLLLALADGPRQQAAVGDQHGGRVGFFLRVEDFAASYERLRAARVTFLEAPRSEPYGQVVVFLDIAGNRWDLLGPEGSNPGG